ncbi:MAG: sigma-70 family RNA polymerase sigma factor [Chitinophagaceae bacterium]|nr:sigma-70 family RNA polymerase sigma factor [Chitinophagaceae bacterium]
MPSSNLKNLKDDDLIYLFRDKQSTEAFGILYDRYAHLVYGVCMKYLKHPENSKDATMQIFEKLMKDIPRHKIQIFKAWLYRVAQNHCLMILRANNHQTKSVDIFPENSVEYEDTMHPVMEKEVQLDKMELALQHLNLQQKQCIELFYLEKKTYTEIMQETGFTFMQVKSHIQNGKRNLKTLMNENLNHE